jgi:hypothetical protein
MEQLWKVFHCYSRPLKNNTSLNTTWALGSLAQGEVIDANSY